jgi:16S rRNA (cytosine967-C5)-methyltransferase
MANDTQKDKDLNKNESNSKSENNAKLDINENKNQSNNKFQYKDIKENFNVNRENSISNDNSKNFNNNYNNDKNSFSKNNKFDNLNNKNFENKNLDFKKNESGKQDTVKNDKIKQDFVNKNVDDNKNEVNKEIIAESIANVNEVVNQNKPNRYTKTPRSYGRNDDKFNAEDYKVNLSEEVLKKIENKTDSISMSENKTYFIDRSQLSEKTQRVLNGPRFSAVKILNRYDRSDSYVDVLLNNELNKNDLSNLDKSLLTEIVNGVIRWRAKLDWVLNGFYHGEFQKCLNFVKNAMRVGLYQMLFLNRVPHSAAIDDSVEIVKHIQGDKAAGLVNGVLRNIARNIANIRYPSQTDDYPHYLGIIYSHPKWMTKRWLERFGNDDTIKLLESNNKIPKIPIRVNANNYTIEELAELFLDKSIPYSKVDKFDNILWLEQNINVAQSELFKNGKITIQDPSASLVPLLCNPKPNDLVIDLCSAPGGKTVYLAELMNNKGTIIALDKFANRLKLVDETAKRMGFTIIETKEADSRDFKLENKEFANIVLVDAPCSGLGTLTKKPEIKWKREIEAIYDMAKLQYEILTNAAKLVKVGGAIIYSTCTIEPEENTQIIAKFLENNKNFVVDDASNYVNPEFTKDGFIQTLPHIHNIDGAFGARLIRKS